MHDFDIVVIGELNADLVLSGDVTPAFGQVEKLVDDATLTLGSSSAIFACGAARLGLKVAFIGVVGDDTIGQFVLRCLHERGIDTQGVIVDPQIKTGLTVILSRGNDRAILTYLGSIAALRYDQIDMKILESSRHLHFASYFLQSALRPSVPELFTQAKALGLSISLDTNYDPEERWEGLDRMLPLVDHFLPNEIEARAITGAADTQAALARLAARIPIVAIKCGAAGAWAQQGHSAVNMPVPAVQVVDTVGAGDSFDAGFVYGVLADWNLEQSLKLGVLCGALSTRAAGGTAAQPTLEEALVASNGRV